MRVFVTGAAGYIGSVTTALLLERGHRVVALDDYSTGHRAAVPPGAEPVAGDLLRPEGWRDALAGVDACVHFAGRIAVGESMADPGTYFAVNVGGAALLLRELLAAGVPRFVFSSSAGVYGSARRIPIRESAPLRPESVYGETKRMAEEMAAWAARTRAISAVALRYFNAAGARGPYGEDHRPETHLIPLAVDAALGLGPPLRLFGTDWPTPDGTPLRDYIHVRDLAEAHVAALERPLAGFVPCNLGSGHGASVREVVQAVERVLGRPVPAEIAPRRPGDPPALVATISRARRVLGWRPRCSELDRVVADAAAWRQAHPHGYEGG